MSNGCKNILSQMGIKKFLVSNGSKKNIGIKWVKNNFGCQMGVKKIYDRIGWKVILGVKL